ncbi:hypothetical protein AB0F43_25870 [Kribbella sp. NPDC023972]|uniref:hypothetical protein n=1 Tax=Kribbella sp. NPDC023972 TaxID=3154795 RepID=UPI0033ED700E
MNSAEPLEVFVRAATSLNELARLEQVRTDFTAEECEELLTGLGSVTSASSHLADIIAQNLDSATSRAGWREGATELRDAPDQMLSVTAGSVRLVSAQLTEVAATISSARRQLGHLHLAGLRQRKTGTPPAAGAGQL